MKPNNNFATLIERYFTERLMGQRDVSANTIASYRDTFRLLLKFAKLRLHKLPSALTLDDLDAPFISAFLDPTLTPKFTFTFLFNHLVVGLFSLALLP